MSYCSTAIIYSKEKEKNESKEKSSRIDFLKTGIIQGGSIGRLFSCPSGSPSPSSVMYVCISVCPYMSGIILIPGKRRRRFQFEPCRVLNNNLGFSDLVKSKRCAM